MFVPKEKVTFCYHYKTAHGISKLSLKDTPAPKKVHLLKISSSKKFLHKDQISNLRTMPPNTEVFLQRL